MCSEFSEDALRANPAELSRRLFISLTHTSIFIAMGRLAEMQRKLLEVCCGTCSVCFADVFVANDGTRGDGGH